MDERSTHFAPDVILPMANGDEDEEERPRLSRSKSGKTLLECTPPHFPPIVLSPSRSTRYLACFNGSGSRDQWTKQSPGEVLVNSTSSLSAHAAVGKGKRMLIGLKSIGSAKGMGTTASSFLSLSSIEVSLPRSCDQTSHLSRPLSHCLLSLGDGFKSQHKVRSKWSRTWDGEQTKDVIRNIVIVQKLVRVR